MRKPFMNRFLLFSLLGVMLFFTAPSGGWGQDIIVGQKLSLSSKVLGEERQLLIHLPKDYNLSDARYPVLYLLDGDAYFHFVTATVGLLTQSNKMPQVIIVGLANRDRERDFLPTHMDHVATSGGGDNFISFFEKELIPFIDNTYRTASYRILVGHSFGGLFTVYTMLERPALFNAYIAISPSLHWDKGLILKKALTFFERTLSFKKFLYMVMGDEGDAMLNSINAFCKILETKAPANLSHYYTFMKEENHMSTVHRAVYLGLSTLFKDYQLTPEAIKSLAEMKKHYDRLSKTLGYEVVMPETILNQLGYTLLIGQKLDEAMTTFQLNVQLHPGSPNVYDSLGEAYEAGRQLEEAKTNYEKAYKLGKELNHPDVEVFNSHIQRVEKKQIEKRP